MPIGTNKLMQMGGGGGDSTPYIAASGGSLSTGSHSDADNIPLTLHSWQSSGTSTFSIDDISGSGEGVIYVWAWGGAGGNGGQGGNGGGSGGFAFGSFPVVAGQSFRVAVGGGGGNGSGCYGCWGAGGAGSNGSSWCNGGQGRYAGCRGCSAGGGGGGAGTVLYNGTEAFGNIWLVAGGGGGGGSNFVIGSALSSRTAAGNYGTPGESSHGFRNGAGQRNGGTGRIVIGYERQT